MQNNKFEISGAYSRREFIKISGLATAAVMTSGSCRAFSQSPKPNIIFIMADDLGWGDLGCYGQTKIRTPVLDQMAREGIRFTSAYSGSPECAPCRSTLMTGQHTGRTRVRSNKSNITGERVPLLPEDITVAEVLKSAGYATGIIGKWGLGDPGSTGIPTRQGFDYWFGYLNQHNAHYYYPPFLWRNEEKVELPENKEGKRGSYSHDLFADEALKFIERNQAQPFFLYLPFTIPHAELLVPEDSFNEYKGQFIEDKPFVGEPGGYASQPAPHATYAAMITRMDRDIDRILQKLEDLNLDDNTLVFFTSDNGPSDAGGIDEPFFNSSGPFRGAKGDVYEGGIRVPMIVRWPGKIKPGRETDQPIATWDFMPTATEIAGIDAPKEIDGISYLPTLLDKPGQNQHDYFYWEQYTKRTAFQAVRMGDWKALRLNPDEPIQVYNLANDIAETKDVADQHPEIVNKARHLFETVHVEAEHWPMMSKKPK